MLITTRFGNSNQLHYVNFRVAEIQADHLLRGTGGQCQFRTGQGSDLLFGKDIGGNEFAQLFRFDLATNKVTMLTDGKRSQNGGATWNHVGDRIAYASTMRNGKDRDIRVMESTGPDQRQGGGQNAGGGWGVAAWSPDDTQLLLTEGLSANESRIHIVDLRSGAEEAYPAQGR